MSNTMCAEQDLTNDDGKPNNGAVSENGTIGGAGGTIAGSSETTGEISSGLNANPSTQNTSLGATATSAFGAAGPAAADTSGAAGASSDVSTAGGIGPAN